MFFNERREISPNYTNTKQQLCLSQKQTTKGLYKPVLRFVYWRNKVLFKVRYSNVFKYSNVSVNVLENEFLLWPCKKAVFHFVKEPSIVFKRNMNLTLDETLHTIIGSYLLNPFPFFYNGFSFTIHIAIGIVVTVWPRHDTYRIIHVRLFQWK